MKVKLGVVSVQDYERAKTFYSEKLGFNVVTDAKFGENSRWIELEIPGGETKIALFTAPGKEFEASPCSNIVFGTNDIHAKYKELKDKGVVFTQPPKEESWGISSLFQDSEGNTFCLSQEK